MILDFAAFESSIIRIQFLLTSNAEERKRYAEKKLKIEATSQAVRANTAELRVQLEEAQRTLACRKEYDAMAEKIISNRALRPREEQHSNIEKLNAEIAELQRESLEYAEIWNRRRQQFDKIIDQTTEMQRQIKDEKEEVERREGMEDRDDTEDEHKGSASGVATPKIDAGSPTPMQGVEVDAAINRKAGLTADVEPNTQQTSSPLRNPQLTGDSEGNKDSAQDVDEGEVAEDGEVSTENDRNAEGQADQDMEEGGHEDGAPRREDMDTR